MEKSIENQNLQQFALQFGLIAGLIRVLIDYSTRTLDLGPMLYYSTFIICFIAEVILIVYLHKKFKKINLSLSMSEALKIGIIVMIFIGLLYSGGAYIYDTYIDPNFQINTAIAWIDTFAPASEQRDAMVAQITQEQKNSSAIGIFIAMLWFAFIGLIISLISGSILQTKERDGYA